MAKQKFYVVWSGREPGIFTSWEDCRAQVRGFAGARYKAYGSRAEAERAFIESADEQIYGGPAPDRDPDPGPPGGPDAPRPRRRTKPAAAPHHPALARGEWVVYTDGGADPNPGPGGYGVVVLHAGPGGAAAPERREFSAGFARTTNNRMELMGWIAGLEATPVDAAVAVFSDSKYVGDMFARGFAHGWRERGWRTSGRRPAANVDLWTRLLRLTDERRVGFTFVRGHTGVPENERCDELAGEAMTGALTEDAGYNDGGEAGA